MCRSLFFALGFLFTVAVTAGASTDLKFICSQTVLEGDTARLAELDRYWNEVSKTVTEGDFDGYSALYHEDAVVIFATGENKRSMSISKALAGWKKGFEDTKAGKANSQVAFRLSQRINDEESAHETGIFKYSSIGYDGKEKGSYVVFEMLLVKKEGKWLGVMELQKSIATKEEWEALK